ncbi:M3KCL protein, partial [Polyodon spathula]|nr:M3KCL protein [Polyodon spathula]
MAKEFCDVKKEMALLEERKKKLMAELDDDEKENLVAAQLEREFRELAEENQTLISCHNHYSEQLEILRVQNQKRQGSS